MSDIKSIEDLLIDFRENISGKTIEDYSALFLSLDQYLVNKRKRDIRTIPGFLLELDNTLEDIDKHLKSNNDIITNQDILDLIKSASNFSASLSSMTNVTMMSTDPKFFERVSILKNKITKISDEMNLVITLLGTNEYVLKQTSLFLSLIN